LSASLRVFRAPSAEEKTQTSSTLRHRALVREPEKGLPDDANESSIENSSCTARPRKTARAASRSQGHPRHPGYPVSAHELRDLRASTVKPPTAHFRDLRTPARACRFVLKVLTCDATCRDTHHTGHRSR
jgi:hypothetical protein